MNLKKRPFLFNNIIILAYCVAFFVFSQYNALTNIYYINDDFPQHLIWLYQYQANFFQHNDFYLMASEAIQPWGVYWVNRFFSIFFSPLTISKFFPFFLLYATCWFTFFLLRKRFGWALAFAAVIMMGHIPLARMAGFFARAYAFPLLLGFLYFWINDNKKGILAMILASTLFYPTIFLVECGIIGLHYLKSLFKKELLANYKQHLPLLGMIVFCGLLLLLKSYQLGQNELIGEFLTKKELLSLPEFGAGGRVDFIKNTNLEIPLNFRWNIFLRFPFSGYAVHTILLFLVLLLINRWRGHTKVAKFDETLFFLFISGTTLFYLAIWQLPRLFLPERYIYYTYLPFLFLLVVRIFALTQHFILKPIKVFQVYAKVFIGVVMLTFLVYSTFVGLRSPKDAGVYNYGHFRNLHDKINTFQEPLLFAGPPSAMSQVPTYCKQSVLFSEEAVHAIYFRNYYNYVKPRVDDLVQAYISTEVEDIVNFVKKYQIDYLVVDKDFLSKKSMWFYEPYGTMIYEKMEGLTPEDLAFAKLPEHVYEDAGWLHVLVNCKKLLEEMDTK